MPKRPNRLQRLLSRLHLRDDSHDAIRIMSRWTTIGELRSELHR